MARWFVLVVGLLMLTASVGAQPRRRAPAAMRTAPDRVCVPGAQTGCDCPNGGRGVQVCAADGSGLEACRCLPAPGSAEAAAPSFVGAPAPVFASPPPAVVRPRDPPFVTRWYGWQPLLFDVAAAGISIGGTAADSPPVQLVGGIVSVLGAPIAHMTHGRYGAAGASFAARLLNLGSAVLALRDDDPERRQGFLILAGVLHAVVVTADAWWLSMERVPRVQVPSVAGVTGGGVLVLRDGAALNVTGTF